jgi:hypothetical protein
MARNFDDFPNYDPVIKDKTPYLSSIWVVALATFIQTLQEYLTMNGIFVPRITTAERDALQNVVNGQMIYNTTLNKFQGYENSAWANLI